MGARSEIVTVEVAGAEFAVPSFTVSVTVNAPVVA
jgi:hypothetical protein